MKVLRDTAVVWVPKGNRTNRLYILTHTCIIYVCLCTHTCVYIYIYMYVCVKNWLMQLCMEVKSQELQWVS